MTFRITFFLNISTMSIIIFRKSLFLRKPTKYFQLKRYNAWYGVENNPANREVQTK